MYQNNPLALILCRDEIIFTYIVLKAVVLNY